MVEKNITFLSFFLLRVFLFFYEYRNILLYIFLFKRFPFDTILRC